MLIKGVFSGEKHLVSLSDSVISLVKKPAVTERKNTLYTWIQYYRSSML
jgi:hypothetical protein